MTSETFTLQVKRVPLVLRKRMRRVLADLERDIREFVIDAIDEKLQGYEDSGSGGKRAADQRRETPAERLSGDRGAGEGAGLLTRKAAVHRAADEDMAGPGEAGVEPGGSAPVDIAEKKQKAVEALARVRAPRAKKPKPHCPHREVGLCEDCQLVRS